MKKLVILSVTLSFTFSLFSIASGNSGQQVALQKSLSSMPLAFTENQGQWPDSILYRASAGGATMWFTPTGVYYQFTRRISRTDDSLDFFPKHHFMDRKGVLAIT